MNQTSLFNEFKKSLKDPCAEELVDLAIYRPLGFLCVKVLYPFPVTPNQITFLAMVAGITGGFFFAKGDRFDFAVGALLYGLANVLDCCDGMIARLKNNGTKTGRIIDGAVDYITSASVYIGFAVGLSRAMARGTLYLPFNAWLLVMAAAISTALHAVYSDSRRNAYLELQHSSGPSSPENERESWNAELGRLDLGKGRALDKFLIRVYLAYIRLQSGKPRRSVDATPSPVSRATVILWNLIGPSTHISFLIAAALLYRPAVFFVFTIVFANCWMIFLFFSKMLSVKGRR
jgi:phosphatidylglycerophosphate synthase